MDKLCKCGVIGYCGKCQNPIDNCNTACEALHGLYHTSCFVCCSCGLALKGKSFYTVNGRVYCVKDYKLLGYQHTVKRCIACGKVILKNIIQAVGRTYHPECFRCSICQTILDGAPFTVDLRKRIYCLDDYYKTFAPRCAVCSQPITPVKGSEETVRLVSMGRDFHVDCYKCENCDVQLGEHRGRSCYPFEGHLLCYQCHISRLIHPRAS